MSYDPLKRDSTWQMVLPGCYIDPAGAGHLFPQEFIAFLSVAHPEAGFDPHSKADYDLVVEYMIKLTESIAPDVPIKFVKHELQEN